MELLAVVAVLAVLMAILMPALKRSKFQANRSVCMSHQRVVLNAANVYATDWTGFYPPSYDFWSHRVSVGNRPQGSGILVAEGYLPQDRESIGKLLFCVTSDPAWNWRSPNRVHHVLVQDPDGGDAYATYCHRFLSGHYRTALRTDSVSVDTGALYTDYVYNADDPDNTTSGNFALYWDIGSTPAHEGEGVNAAMHDTSVSWIPFSEVERLPQSAHWLGIYADHYWNGNLWYWAGQYR